MVSNKNYKTAQSTVRALSIPTAWRMGNSAHEVNVEEQLRGRLAQVAEVRNGELLSNAYRRLMETVTLLSEFRVLQYDANSHTIYQSLKIQRVRAGTQDLRIASITLAHNGVLLTRNLQDFEKVPGLTIQSKSL